MQAWQKRLHTEVQVQLAKPPQARKLSSISELPMELTCARSSCVRADLPTTALKKHTASGRSQRHQRHQVCQQLQPLLHGLQNREHLS